MISFVDGDATETLSLSDIAFEYHRGEFDLRGLIDAIGVEYVQKELDKVKATRS